MKIAIYSPYIDTVGGGEKYILTIAEYLSKKEKVDVLLDKHLSSLDLSAIKYKIERLQGLNLENISFIQAPVGKGSSFFKRLIFLKKYDWLFYLTDGSIFFSTSANSIIHFQVPFENSTSRSSWGKIKLSSWKKAIYNSNFTKDIVEKTWKIPGQVIYPPVSINLFKSKKKLKQILSVGRFFGFLKDKKHQLLIDVFKQNYKIKDELAEWSLHLAGGAGQGDFVYLEELKKSAANFPIHFYSNIPLKKLTQLYGESSIYWHASGFGETDPKKFEHFGITTVEAMAAGCVPIVIDQGGQKEIVENNDSGYLWNDVETLIEKTIILAKDNNLREELASNAKERAKEFSKEKFEKRIKELVYG